MVKEERRLFCYHSFAFLFFSGFSWYLGWAISCDCSTPGTFPLPLFLVLNEIQGIKINRVILTTNDIKVSKQNLALSIQHRK